MLPRILSCALCALFVAPCWSEVITVEDGDSFDRINVTPDRELVVNGGYVEEAWNRGSLVTINGGSVDYVIAENFDDQNGGHAPKVVITGHNQQFGQWLDDGPNVSFIEHGDAEIHGYNFRVYTSRSSHSGVYAGGVGWLLNGSMVDFHLRFRNFQELHQWQSATLVTHDPVFVDPTGDWGFDLNDLNIIRNNFGSQGREGDTNFDGVVDLADLNLVRNKFGLKYPDAMPQEWEWSGSVPLSYLQHWNPTMPIPVPEPSTMALGFFALAGIPLRCRYRSWLRRSP